MKLPGRLPLSHGIAQPAPEPSAGRPLGRLALAAMTDSDTSARRIAPATGTLGVLTPGMGAVASTFIAGVLAARRGLSPPIGSISQMAHIRLGTKTEGRNPPVREFVPLAGLDDLVFGGWDPLSANVLEAARACGVLEERDLGAISAELEGVVAMDAVFDRQWVSRLDGVRVKPPASKWDQAQSVMEDIESFRSSHECDRLVMVWCGSTEAYSEPAPAHESVASFEAGLRADDPSIAPSQIYAYAALQSDVPFANGAPNLTVDLPCMEELSATRGVPVAGKDFKTGQTLLKTLIAPGLKARMLGLRGWFSTNILGNRDGEVLDAPARTSRPRRSRSWGVLEHDPAAGTLSGALFDEIHNVVRINYYPPRGDNKEGWDNIDIFGWLGRPDAAQGQLPVPRLDPGRAPGARPGAVHGSGRPRRRERHPGVAVLLLQGAAARPGSADVEHDLFIQQTKLKNTLRQWMGEEPVTHSEAG